MKSSFKLVMEEQICNNFRRDAEHINVCSAVIVQTCRAFNYAARFLNGNFQNLPLEI